jgi:hypothetical protein
MKLLPGAMILGLVLSLLIPPRLANAKHGDEDEEGQKHGGNGQGHHHGDHHHHGQDYDYDKHYYKQEKHHHHHEEAAEDSYRHGHHHYRGPYFNDQRVTMIRNYYTPAELDSLPPGLRKHIERTGHLPPGLEKKLVINEPLPPEYVPYMVPAPPPLINTMGPLPPDSQLYLYNGDAVLVNPKTQAVLDVVHGVLTLTGH